MEHAFTSLISEDGIFLIETKSGIRKFCFLSDSSFRLYEPDSPISSCVQGAIPIKDGVTASKDGSTYRFGYGKVAVEIDEELRIQVRVNGELVLDATQINVTVQGGDYSLAEKEGHHTSRGSGAQHGLHILNDRPVYGLGERTGPLDKRGYSYTNWNTDDPSAHVDTFPSLYQSIPFVILFDPKVTVGLFIDNTFRMDFDINKSDEHAVEVRYEKGCQDIYVFLGTLPEVIKKYTALTGRNPLVPYWALGAQQCRWSYPTASKVDEVIKGYRDADMPLSCVYLDIDYMDAYKDFTVDASKLPDIASWLKQKEEDGIKIVPIIDAGVKAEEGYFLYDEGMEQGYFSTLNGETYHNEVWPGDSVFPAFIDERVQDWWANHIKEFLELGFAGIWNDMNEPASFRGPLPMDVDMGKGVLHEQAHNIYGHSMVKAGAKGFEQANKRLFQLTRAGYAGTCRYSSTWAGDNQSIYDHLRLSLPQLMNMSLSGQAYIGVDLGGFGGDATPELLARWAVGGLLNPLYRNHSALGTKGQEPYLLPEPYKSAYRDALKLRYKIRPALYTELYLAETQGSIALRPLVYNYPDDSRTYNENTQVMYGRDLLLIPSLFPGQQCRAAYFPEDYVHIITGKAYPKGDHLIGVRIGDIPLFLRKGALLATEEGENLVLLASSKDAETLYYEDAGDGLEYRKGEYNLIRYRLKDGKLITEPIHEGITPKHKNVIVRYL